MSHLPAGALAGKGTVATCALFCFQRLIHSFVPDVSDVVSWPRAPGVLPLGHVRVLRAV